METQCSIFVETENVLIMYGADFIYFPVFDFPYCPTKLVIRSFLYPEVETTWKDIHNSKKTVSFDDMVHGIDGDDLVTHVVLNGRNTL